MASWDRRDRGVLSVRYRRGSWWRLPRPWVWPPACRFRRGGQRLHPPAPRPPYPSSPDPAEPPVQIFGRS